jgi:hypothetical protein
MQDVSLIREFNSKRRGRRKMNKGLYKYRPLFVLHFICPTVWPGTDLFETDQIATAQGHLFIGQRGIAGIKEAGLVEHLVTRQDRVDRQ